ncbi:endonuclease/exonuclease/phosphatase family protein [Streptomyces sp. NPDC059247]|uniref:endonuclease/exonuclease/phosphatase family protein n=1 Tax=Streptomyces sp. NPDC059247 TaxID=3346790 RepID=UPI0036AB66AB
MRSLRTLAAALATAAALLFTTLASPTPAAADTVPVDTPQSLRFVTYNICGHSCPEGKGPAPGGYSNARRIAAVVAEASGPWKADQIHLQEVCQQQYDELGAKLAPLGFSGKFAATVTGKATVCGGQAYGVAVFVKGTVVRTATIELTQSNERELIRVPCVQTLYRSRLSWACSIHLYWDDNSLRDAEAAVLRRQAESWERAGTPVVLGGDFNGFPDENFMDGFYRPALGGGAQGVFDEADQTDNNPRNTPACPAGTRLCRGGEPTFRGPGCPPVTVPETLTDCKIDYIFFSSRHFRHVVGDSMPLDNRVTDHHMVRGAADWNG